MIRVTMATIMTGKIHGINASQVAQLDNALVSARGFAYTQGTPCGRVLSRRPVEAGKARHASPRVAGERLQARATTRW